MELDEKFHFLKKGAKVLDLGAAPGGWSQVAAAKGATVVAADVLEMEEIPGVTFFQGRSHRSGCAGDAESRRWMAPPMWCMTDMAAPTTGHRATDHIRTIALVEIALDVALDTLKPGGAFVGKVFQGGSSSAAAGGAEKGLPRGQARQAAGQPGGIGGIVCGGAWF